MMRIVQLDVLRGLMLVIMMANHLIYFPLNSLESYTYNITFQSFGFVSGAEGFIFLSGLIFGIVYSRKYQQGGLSLYDRLTLRRFGVIYLYYIGTYALIAALFSWQTFAAAWPYNWDSQEMIKAAPWHMFARGAVFVHQTGLLDILPMYLFFLVLALPAMRLLIAGRLFLLLGLSLLLWLVGQSRPQLLIEEATGLHLGWFELLSGQLIFVAGLAFGYQKAMNDDFALPLRGRLIVAALVFCAPLFIYRHQLMLPEEGAIYPVLFSDRGFGAVRLLNAIALAYLLYALVQWRPAWFSNCFLAGLGANAIKVFCYHIIVCYALMPLRDTLAELPLGWRLLIWAGLLASLYLPVAAARLWKKKS